MTSTPIETELTTAVTDILLALVCWIAVLKIVQSPARHIERQQAAVWAIAFTLMALAAIVGTVIHGFEMKPALQKWLDHPLYLFLGLAVSFFVAGVLIDLKRSALPIWIIAIPVVLGAAFYALTVIRPGSFQVFILYEAGALVFALGAYFYLWLRFQKSFSLWMMTGIALSILAAGIQASGSASVQMIWTFDHNSLFHIIQTVAIFVLMRGLLSRGFERTR
ncbi:MAG: hypothetical protein WBM02_12660 [bacterium]